MAEDMLYSSAESTAEESETSEEEWHTELELKELTVNEKERKTSKCEKCVSESPYESSMRENLSRTFALESRYERGAVFLCCVCEIYVCVKCLPEHESHEGINVGRKEKERQEEREGSEKMGEKSERKKKKKQGLLKKIKLIVRKAESVRKNDREESESGRMREQNERERILGKIVHELMNECEMERTKKLKNSHAVICDRVNVKHKFDQSRYCEITGLCVLRNKRWVVCDFENYCIKIFELGSNILQRYIRFDSQPRDVTEIHLQQNFTEMNLASGSSSDISGTDRAELNEQCLIAVTLPKEHEIMFIDLSKKPAIKQNIWKTEGECRSISFYDEKIFTVCSEDLYTNCSVYIKSTDGDTLKKIDIGFSGYPGPYLAVVSGRVYLPDSPSSKVYCRNIEGQVISELKIVGSGPLGISVDPDNNVYLCAWLESKIYKLDSNLTKYKTVLDQSIEYIKDPHALCFHRDKLFISHYWTSSLHNFVTVVRLL